MREGEAKNFGDKSEFKISQSVGERESRTKQIREKFLNTIIRGCLEKALLNE